MNKAYDTLHMGRSSIDLDANDIGAPFSHIGSFAAYVGGDWGWYKSARLGNACGAIVVTQHGCANFMPTLDEVLAFVESYGGLD